MKRGIELLLRVIAVGLCILIFVLGAQGLHAHPTEGGLSGAGAPVAGECPEAVAGRAAGAAPPPAPSTVSRISRDSRLVSMDHRIAPGIPVPAPSSP